MSTNRSSGKKARNNSKQVYEVAPPPSKEHYRSNSEFKEVTPLNFIQGEYFEAIKSNEIVFGIGSAGTGKTYIAAMYAASQLFHRNVDRIILTRPNIETGRGLGFLPGTLEEKYAPYLAPFDNIFTKALGKGFYEYSLKTKAIDPKPLGFMRGETFENCIVLMDEAQNATKEEFKMILSRIGKNCKMIISGDIEQSDIGEDSGLDDAVYRLQYIDGIEVVRFMDDDIVRSKMCKSIIQAYRN